MRRLNIAIAAIVQRLVAACSVESDDFETEPVSKPVLTPITTAAPEIHSCYEIAADLRLRLRLP